jgi:hypothetical protein
MGDICMEDRLLLKWILKNKVRVELFVSDKTADISYRKRIKETSGSMEGSKEENHYNIAVMSSMQCRVVMQ